MGGAATRRAGQGDHRRAARPSPPSACGSSSSSPSRPASGARGASRCRRPRTRPGPDRHVITLALGAPRTWPSSSTDSSSPSRSPATCSRSTPSTSPTWPSPRPTRTRCSSSLPLPAMEEAAAGARCSGGWASRCGPGDYVSLQAYLPFGQDDALEALRRRVRDHLGGAAVTAGYGPRFLHSTGQLHKGGPNSVVCVQLVRAGRPARAAHPGQAVRLRHPHRGPVDRRPPEPARPRSPGAAGRGRRPGRDRLGRRAVEHGTVGAGRRRRGARHEDRHGRARQDGRQHDRAPASRTATRWWRTTSPPTLARRPPSKGAIVGRRPRRPGRRSSTRRGRPG